MIFPKPLSNSFTPAVTPDVPFTNQLQSVPRRLDGNGLERVRATADGLIPGRFLYNLAHHVDTRSYPNGLYEVTVDVSDMRGNSSEAVLQVSIENRAGTATGCVKEFNPAACGDALL